MDNQHHNFDAIEDKLIEKEQDKNKKIMPISGKSVFRVKQFLNQKTDHQEKK